MAGKARGGDDWAVPMPVRRVERDPCAALPDDHWPLTIPAVAHVMREGLDLAPATVLVGENGSG
jgi:predicted ATPase